MYRDDDILELINLPPYGSFPLGSMDKVAVVEQPIREVEAVDSIYPNGTALAAPIGGVYVARYLDGSAREIFVSGNPLERNFNTATFLKDGRKGNKLSDVRELLILDAEDPVPKWLVARLRIYEACRDMAASPRPDVA